jgi:myo-inositol-1(or 4)-monophosphatase
VIDPLDGTTNYMRGIPHYAVSIACLYRGKIEHAVVLDPVRREEFTASRGRGAQLNGRRIRVSNVPSLEGALLGTGIPFKNHCDDKLEAYSKTLELLAGQCAGIRRAGAASLDLAYVAAGRLDAFWEIGLAQWDIAAGALLIREAGGLVADIDGSDNFMSSGNIVGGSPKCFKAVLQTTKPLLG